MIIGICGLIGSGKGTVADILVEGCATAWAMGYSSLGLVR